MAVTKRQRFLFVDGLRGIAAMMVVLFHFTGAVSEVSSEWVYPVIELILSYGYLGVDIFFVISGFVISYSVSNADYTPAFLLRFGIRRSIRLDPPYWITIILELILIKVGLSLFENVDTPFPETGKIVAHFFYMQQLLGYGDIIPLFWSLCYEVQFYLVYVGSLVLAQFVMIKIGAKASRLFLITIGTVAFLWSVLIYFGPMEDPIQGLFILRWYQFFMGVLVMQCCRKGKVTITYLSAAMLVISGSLIHPEIGADNGLTTVLAASVLVIAARRKTMTEWLSGPVALFMGRISYSLYLIHTVVGWRLIKLIRELYGTDFSPLQAWIVLLLGVVASIFSAWIMYRIIEAPSLRVCHQIRMDQPLNWNSLRQIKQTLHERKM